MIILSIFFFITAILYSSVGFGGGSTYLALMLIWELPYYIFPIIALFCNIIVVSGNSINYLRSGDINLRLLIPYLVGSIPFAFFGASISIEKDLFEIFLFLVLVTAGILASLFSFPSGIIRALGGWMSDRMGARRVMYWVLGVSVAISFMLIIPKMEIYSPGQGIMAKADGVVTNISKTDIVVDDMYYHYVRKPEVLKVYSDKMLVFPTKEIWQEPNVKVGQKINRKMLLAKGVTKIFFQANVWIFAVLVIILGSVWGVGKAAVYKLIPDYFPDQVGVVGGMVGVLGGLGGFFCPIIFGYLLDTTGLWTSCWMFMFLISVICLLWLNKAATNVMKKKYPNYKNLIDDSDK